MNRPHAHGPQVEPSLIPQEGWHCTHIYYSLDRVRLSRLELAPVENLDDVELIGLVQRVDRAIVLMSPDISYAGILASRYLEGKFPEFVYSRRVVLCLTCLSIQA